MKSGSNIKNLKNDIENVLEKYKIKEVLILHNTTLFKMRTIGSDGETLFIQTKKEGSRKI